MRATGFPSIASLFLTRSVTVEGVTAESRGIAPEHASREKIPEKTMSRIADAAGCRA